jgi:hypothetical protein
MNKLKSCLWLAAMVAAVPTQLYAQPPAPLKNIEVTAVVDYAPKNTLFTYRYVVRNPGTNQDQVTVVKVDISKGNGGEQLSSERLLIEKKVDLGGRKRGRFYFPPQLKQGQAVEQR